MSKVTDQITKIRKDCLGGERLKKNQDLRAKDFKEIFQPRFLKSEQGKNFEIETFDGSKEAGVIMLDFFACVDGVLVNKHYGTIYPIAIRVLNKMSGKYKATIRIKLGNGGISEFGKLKKAGLVPQYYLFCWYDKKNSGFGRMGFIAVKDLIADIEDEIECDRIHINEEDGNQYIAIDADKLVEAGLMELCK